MKLELGEIGIVNLKVKDNKNKIYYINDVLFSNPYEEYKRILKQNNIEDRRLIKKIKKEEDLYIINIEVIKKVGFKNKNKKYTKAIVHKEERNKITGAYE